MVYPAMHSRGTAISYDKNSIFAQLIMHNNENGPTRTTDISLMRFIVNFHTKRILQVTWQCHLLGKIHSRPIEDLEA